MSEVCRINIGRGPGLYEEIDRELRHLADRIRERYHATRVLVFGSYVRGDLHQGSDIDLLVVGDFPQRFHHRPSLIRDLTDLPVEALCYTADEFEAMVREKNSFILDILGEGKDL
jgi:predicted nucleotidyltransferase